MTVRQLQRQLEHACKMHRLTRQRGWQRAIARINREIMARCRPVRA
jgi:hypothetical protein